MLDMTLATTFTPGSNTKYEVSGANWTYLLPRFALGQIVCFGAASDKARMTLSRLGKAVYVYDATKTGPQAQEAAGEDDEPHRLHWVSGALPLESGSTELVYLADDASTRRFLRDEAFAGEVHRILATDGVIYFEITRSIRWPDVGKQVEARALSFGRSARYWMTPRYGEALTAVPASDHQTQQYFLRHELYSPSMNLTRLKAVKASRRGRAQPRGSLTEAPLSSPARPAGKTTSRSGLYEVARAASMAAQNTLNHGERLLYRYVPSLSRSGVLVGTAASDAVPEYLRDIAGQSGLDISGFRWGLSARGEYRSRKVLFFLFEPDSAQPRYIVKLVRDSTFNARIENEHRALKLLEKTGVADGETVPRSVFFGYHGGLALVGESIVAGVPFKGSNDAGLCPVALNWLTRLGELTADRESAAPEVIAAGLSILVDRFCEIYHPPDGQQAFLSDQVDCVRQSQVPFPLVFQHGDPGIWNALVTPTRKIAFLDWEAAEPAGMPLWDIFYFWRSYIVANARSSGTRDALDGFSRHFLHESPLQKILVKTTETYCEATGLSRRLVKPLFYLCWVHRALKQATLLAENRLSKGHYAHLITLCLEQQDNNALNRVLLAT